MGEGERERIIIGNSIMEAEDSPEVPRAEGRGQGELVNNEYGVSGWEDEKFRKCIAMTVVQHHKSTRYPQTALLEAG